MKTNREAASDFLRNAESSARNILQKNNAIRSGKNVHKKSIPNELDSLRKLKISPFQPSSGGEESNQKQFHTSANGGPIQSVEEYRLQQNFRKKNACRSGKIGKSPITKKSIEREKQRAVCDELIMDSATLRKRFRCDLGLVDKDSQETSAKHPIHNLIIKHLALVTADVNRMTRRRVSNIGSEVIKGHKHGLEKLKPSTEDNLSSSDTVECLETYLDRHVSELDVSKVQKKKRNLFSINTPCVDKKQQKNSSNLIPILKESKREVPFLVPECWNLVVFEKVDAKSFLSISRIRTFNSDCHENDHFWVFQFFDTMYQSIKKYVLFDNEVSFLVNTSESLLKDNHPARDENFETLDSVIVCRQSITREIDGIDLVGEYSVRMKKSHGMLTAILSVHFQLDETSLHARLIIPVYEIVAILRLNYLCKTLDYKFWFSNDNGVSIFEQLMQQINIFVMKEQSIETLILEPCWLKDQANIILPERNIGHHCSKMKFSQFRNALRMSNVILHSLVANQSSRDKVECILEMKKFQEKSGLRCLLQVKEQMMNVKPLSLRLSHTLMYSKSLIPGACTFGNIGSWRPETKKEFLDDFDCIDRTQLALTFMPQNNHLSPVVTCRLALETPLPVPTFRTFDPTSITPPKAIDEPVNDPISTMMSECSILLEENLISLADKRTLPGTVTIDGRSLTKKDLNDIQSFHSCLEVDNLSFTSEGFRLRRLAHCIKHNSSFPLHKFGISHAGVSPNQTGVNKRTIWHSEERCTHLLSKQRDSRDFFHMIKHKFCGRNGGPANDPLISIIHMDAYNLKSVHGIKLKKQEELQLQKALDAAKAKQKEIISRKIEAADRILNNKLSGTKEKMKECLVGEYSSADEGEDNLLLVDRKVDDEVKRSQWGSLLGPIGVSLIDLNKCKVGSYDENEFYRCTTNQVRTIGIVSIPSATTYSIDDAKFQTSAQTELIEDLLEDRFRLSDQIVKGQRYKDILLNSDQQYALEHILKVPLDAPNEALVPFEIQTKDDMPPKVSNDPNMTNEEKVIQATRHADYEVLEQMLDDCGVDIDSTDEYGNTLLIISGQQGNKKLCKFLLRRGAYINAQNHAGNTILHYLHEYAHVGLADYMIRKGADDTYLNAEGLTCYEGLNINNL